MTTDFHSYIDAHIVTAKRLTELSEAIEALKKWTLDTFNNGGKIILAGNGGSAADCQHVAAEFTGRFLKNRRPLPAIAVTTDTSALTAIGNDFGFSEIFARQIDALGNSGDMLICISTSGNSENILKGLESARKIGIKSALLSGSSGGRGKGMCDLPICVPSDVTYTIQECHIAILHYICLSCEIL